MSATAPCSWLPTRRRPDGRVTEAPHAATRGSGSRVVAAPAARQDELGIGSAAGHTCGNRSKGGWMPPRGVKKGSKRERQYKEIVKSEKSEGRSTKRAKEIAARTVNK